MYLTGLWSPFKTYENARRCWKAKLLFWNTLFSFFFILNFFLNYEIIIWIIFSLFYNFLKRFFNFLLRFLSCKITFKFFSMVFILKLKIIVFESFLLECCIYFELWSGVLFSFQILEVESIRCSRKDFLNVFTFLNYKMTRWMIFSNILNSEFQNKRVLKIFKITFRSFFSYFLEFFCAK